MTVVVFLPVMAVVVVFLPVMAVVVGCAYCRTCDVGTNTDTWWLNGELQFPVL